jgi:hypothetical protein
VNARLVEEIANAVLYEGYILYPYRASSVKNRQRFNFGVFAPRDYCESRASGEAWSLQAECLVRGSLQSALNIQLRFLHLTSRNVGQLIHPTATVPEGQIPEYRLVPSLDVDGQRFQAWQEAVEREFTLHPSLDQVVSAPLQESFLFSGREETEFLCGADSQLVGILLRKQESITGEVQVSAARVEDGLFKLTLRIANSSSLPNAENEDRDAALLRSLVSTHAILHVAECEFISLLDPPVELRPIVSSCQNTGVWPVLVGEVGHRDAMLASPIILYDYPQIAPESPGELFDGTEIDEILALRILTLTDQEKQEMRDGDGRARRILERTESLPPEHMMKLHGVLRNLRSADREAK